MNNQLQIDQFLLTGKDGLDLLHRISTINMNRFMSSNSPVRREALILNPQGKIEAHFWIEKILTQPDGVLIQWVKDINGSNETKIKKILDQYTFSENYSVGPTTPANVLLDDYTNPSNLKALPGFEFEMDGLTAPFEVGLLSAIDDQKGCYPGQEVIEKVISYGSSPKQLCLLKHRGHASAIGPLFDPKTKSEIGKLTRIHGSYSLGIIRKTHLNPGQTLIDSNAYEYVVEKTTASKLST